ncbi:MAG: hypothetical protein J6Y94_05255 [Bacteriovoracaceae bacterium]|nr:hypothetical protein [Bacteriovoracaceae bacterium]
MRFSSLPILITLGITLQAPKITWACEAQLLPPAAVAESLARPSSASRAPHLVQQLAQIKDLAASAAPATTPLDFSAMIKQRLGQAKNLEELVTLGKQEQDFLQVVRQDTDEFSPEQALSILPDYLAQWLNAYLPRLANALQTAGLNWEVISLPLTEKQAQRALKFSFDPTQNLPVAKNPALQPFAQLLKPIQTYWKKNKLGKVSLAIIYTDLANLDFTLAKDQPSSLANEFEPRQALRRKWLEQNTLLVGQELFSALLADKIELAQLFLDYVGQGRTWTIQEESPANHAAKMEIEFHRAAFPLEAWRLINQEPANSTIPFTSFTELKIDDQLTAKLLGELRASNTQITRHLEWAAQRLRKTIFERNPYRFLRIETATLSPRLKALTKATQDYYYLIEVEYSENSRSLAATPAGQAVPFSHPHQVEADGTGDEAENVPAKFRLRYPIFITAANEAKIQAIKTKFKDLKIQEYELKKYFYHNVCYLTDDPSAKFLGIMFSKLQSFPHQPGEDFWQTWDLFRTSWPNTKGIKYW